MFSRCTECHGGKEIIANLDKRANHLQIWQMIQNPKGNKRLYAKEPNPGVLLYEGKMPVEDYRPMAACCIGQPTCIGHRGSLYIFQFLSKLYKEVDFFAVNVKTKEVKWFEDSLRYLRRNMVMETPVYCHISPDCKTLLIRLSQNILTRRKWSKVLMSTRYGENESPRFNGTDDSHLRDCRDQALAFHPSKPGIVITALVDEFCAKCTLTMHDISVPKGKEVVRQTRYRLLSRPAQQESAENSDEEEEDRSSDLKTVHVSMAFCKSGEVMVVCIFAENNPQPPDYMNYYEGSYQHYVLTVLQFNPETLDCLVKYCHDGLYNKIDSDFLLYFSTCDSEIQMWDYNDGSGRLRIQEVVRMHVHKPLNLKSLCRAQILQKVRTDEVSNLPLPKLLLDYLNFEA